MVLRKSKSKMLFKKGMGKPLGVLVDPKRGAHVEQIV